MRKIKSLIALSGIIFVQAACSNIGQEQTERQQVKPKQFLGMYQGLFPCADCPGIEVNLRLRQDSSFIETFLYQDSNGISATEQGRWERKDSLLILLVPPNQQKTAYWIKTDSTLVMLQQDKKEIRGPLAAFYILAKIEPIAPASFSGNYLAGEKGKGAKKLVLTYISKGNFSVAISSEGEEKDCNFKGKGKLVNDQILVPLKEVNAALDGVMSIRLKNGRAEVFAADFGHRSDLVFFCNGKYSLAGDYKKQ